MPSSPIHLTEYQPLFLPRTQLSEADGVRLWEQFGAQVVVDFPSPKTNGRWRLTSQGWVGSIPLGRDRTLHLLPKVPLNNLLRMWEIAYGLESYKLFDGLVAVETLDDFFSHLALMLATRVQRRMRQGLVRNYVPISAEMPAVRGRIDLAKWATRPPSARVPCHAHHFTADVADNQIALYTLWRIAHAPTLAPAARQAVAKTVRALRGTVSLRTFTAADCLHRSYSRLSAEYELIHALCRFFLDHTGPAIQSGSHQTLPFLINMARLYEQFVAAWLSDHLPDGWHVQAQEQVDLGRGQVTFQIDLVLRDTDGQPTAVVDTKYKLPDRPATADISQIMAYAQARGCRSAVLVYPAPLPQPLDLTLDGMHIRSATFDLSAEIDTAGQAFLASLLPQPTL